MSNETSSILNHLPTHDAALVNAIRHRLQPKTHDDESPTPKKHKHHHTAHHENLSTVADYPHAMSEGELRLAQSYLSVMDYFGPINTVKGTDVVHGKLDKRTQSALEDFTGKHSSAYHLKNAHATREMLSAIEAEYTLFLKANALKPIAGISNAETQRTALALAFQLKTPHNDNWAILNKLHPLMRFPAAAAIAELETQEHIHVVCVESFRDPAKQRALVMEGKSCAPPGYSFHAIGLALDLAPADKHGNATSRTSDPRWKKIYAVMEKHGFYSMMLHDGWDQPHHEIPAKTRDLIGWPLHADGWKDIPADKIPKEWTAINKEALAKAQPLMHLPATPPANLPIVKKAYLARD